MSLETFKYPHAFSLESGETLSGFELAYTTYGTWPANKKGKPTPVIWIFHGLSGSSRLEDWWPWIIGKDQVFDPEEYFIICTNNLGSCYGSTNALSLNTDTNQPYFHSFPLLTIRDMVEAADLLRVDLGIEKIHSCIGPSMGGQMALEWSILRPQLIENLFLIASNAFHSPWGVAFNETQRMAIQSDQTWQQDIPEAGLEGMKAARAVALLSYRSYQTYQDTQNHPEDVGWDNFPAATYQQYQGEKMARRFNAYSYWTLSKAMDSHHVGRGRGPISQVLSGVNSNTFMLGISSDILFPNNEQAFMTRHIPRAQLEIIDSIYGHDGFLIEEARITQTFNDWLKITKNQYI